MGNFFDSIQFVDSVITIVAAISAIVSWSMTIAKSNEIAKSKRYIFLISLVLWGIAAGMLLSKNMLLGAIVTFILFVTILILGRNYRLLLISIVNTQSTVILSKLAIYNVFCETIQRICHALVEEASFSGNDIRVSLFSVDWQSKELTIAGRYPLLAGDIPDIKYSVGRGTSGIAVESNQIIKLENLPEWKKDSDSYIKQLEKYNLSEMEIRNFHIKARCYYAFPIVERDPEEGVNVVRFVISIDSIYPIIASDDVTSNNMIHVTAAYIRNNRQMLFNTIVGRGL